MKKYEDTRNTMVIIGYSVNGVPGRLVAILHGRLTDSENEGILDSCDTSQGEYLLYPSQAYRIKALLDIDADAGDLHIYLLAHTVQNPTKPISIDTVASIFASCSGGSLLSADEPQAAVFSGVSLSEKPSVGVARHLM